MDMSMVEITARANFLIFNYIKKTLHYSEFAEEFRKQIQKRDQKDIIIFKGLEDLTVVLKKYYSSQAGIADESTNGHADSMGLAKDAPGDCKTGSGTKQERKKKGKQEQLIVVAEDAVELPAEPTAEPEEQLQLNADCKAERKRKKKRRQSEAEAGAQPDATAYGHETHAPTAAAEETPAAEAEEGEDKAPKKKRKKNRTALDESGVEEVEAQQTANGTSLPAEPVDAADSTADEGGTNSGKKTRHQKQHNQPYRRVREEEVVNKHFHDNRFEAKPGAAMGWGHKANEDLKPTQGRSFRHEKTKKKRGSYKGGAIDTGVSSFKFESDSE